MSGVKDSIAGKSAAPAKKNPARCTIRDRLACAIALFEYSARNMRSAQPGQRRPRGPSPIAAKALRPHRRSPRRRPASRGRLRRKPSGVRDRATVDTALPRAAAAEESMQASGFGFQSSPGGRPLSKSGQARKDAVCRCTADKRYRNKPQYIPTQ